MKTASIRLLLTNKVQYSKIHRDSAKSFPFRRGFLCTFLPILSSYHRKMTSEAASKLHSTLHCHASRISP